MAANTTRRAVLDELRTRLQAIQVSNGFNTDAGLAVFLGEIPQLGEDDPTQALVLVVGDDAPSYTGENVATLLAVEVQALVFDSAATPDPFDRIEEIIEDIRKALEVPDRTLGGLVKQRGLVRAPTRSIPRQEGGQVVGAAVGYQAPIVEKWGGG